LAYRRTIGRKARHHVTKCTDRKKRPLAKDMDWCLLYTDNESEPFCATDQAVIVAGSPVAPGVTPELLRHPETVVRFPLCWQACLFGSAFKFDVSYDRAHPVHLVNLRNEQKQRCDRFVISPVMY
jgi:hypothetical protein